MTWLTLLCEPLPSMASKYPDAGTYLRIASIEHDQSIICHPTSNSLALPTISSLTLALWLQATQLYTPIIAQGQCTSPLRARKKTFKVRETTCHLWPLLGTWACWNNCIAKILVRRPFASNKLPQNRRHAGMQWPLHYPKMLAKKGYSMSCPLLLALWG